MRIESGIKGSASFHGIIVTRASGEVERYDPYYGDMMDMDACKALAECRAKVIEESPHMREVFYGKE